MEGLKMSGYQGLRAYRRAGVPLLAVECADAAELLRLVVGEVGDGERPAAVMCWDCCRGLVGANKGGQDAAAELNGGMDPAIATAPPSEVLRALLRAPAESVTVLAGMAPFLAEPGAAGAVVCQGVLNLRDVLKASGALVVLAVPLGSALPAALVDSVAVSVLALPGAEELGGIVGRTLDDAGIAEKVDADQGRLAVQSLAGLSAYAAEQSVALSVSRSGLDLGGLWERKRVAIEATKGLRVWRGGERFADLGGLDAVKEYLGAVLRSPRRAPSVVVFLDEIEKAMGGSASDLSGTKQGMLGAFLGWWQDNDVTGLLLMGHPGSGKSAVAKAAGAEVGVATVQLDYDGLQGSLVGQSGANLRAALATVSAVAGNESGRVLVLATCNSLAGLAPELRRRFSLGTWFFDLPSAEERSTIWALWCRRFGRAEDEPRPADEGWTGAEIRACCDVADRTGFTLTQASRYIVPVCRSSAEVIDTRRREASGRLLDASRGGEYRWQPAAVAAAAGRRVTVEG